MKLQPFLNNLYKYHIHYAHCKADIVSRVKISMILCVLIGTRTLVTLIFCRITAYFSHSRFFFCTLCSSIYLLILYIQWKCHFILKQISNGLKHDSLSQRFPIIFAHHPTFEKSNLAPSSLLHNILYIIFML